MKKRLFCILPVLVILAAVFLTFAIQIYTISEVFCDSIVNKTTDELKNHLSPSCNVRNDADPSSASFASSIYYAMNTGDKEALVKIFDKAFTFEPDNRWTYIEYFSFRHETLIAYDMYCRDYIYSRPDYQGFHIQDNGDIVLLYRVDIGKTQDDMRGSSYSLTLRLENFSYKIVGFGVEP